MTETRQCKAGPQRSQAGNGSNQNETSRQTKRTGTGPRKPAANRATREQTGQDPKGQKRNDHTGNTTKQTGPQTTPKGSTTNTPKPRRNTADGKARRAAPEASYLRQQQPPIAPGQPAAATAGPAPPLPRRSELGNLAGLDQPGNDLGVPGLGDLYIAEPPLTGTVRAFDRGTVETMPIAVHIPHARAIRKLNRWAVETVTFVVHPPLTRTVRPLKRGAVEAVPFAVDMPLAGCRPRTEPLDRRDGDVCRPPTTRGCRPHLRTRDRRDGADCR